MSGTGKSEAAQILKNLTNFNIFYFGGVVLEELKLRKLNINNENEKKVREELRQKYGKGVLAKKAIEYIDCQNKPVILDGLYSFSEYKIIKENFPKNFITIAIIADKYIRYTRLKNRNYRPLTEEEVDRRDFAEIENIEKGGPIAVADYNILNNGDINQLESEIQRILNKILCQT